MQQYCMVVSTDCSTLHGCQHGYAAHCMVVSTDMLYIAWLSAWIYSTLQGCQHGYAAHCTIVYGDVNHCVVVSSDMQHAHCMVVSTDMQQIAWLSEWISSTLHGIQNNTYQQDERKTIYAVSMKNL
jgi:hypothetical protein